MDQIIRAFMEMPDPQARCRCEECRGGDQDEEPVTSVTPTIPSEIGPDDQLIP
jgi:hypothetical protein